MNASTLHSGVVVAKGCSIGLSLACAGVQPGPARRLLAPAEHAAVPGAVLGEVGQRLRAGVSARQRDAAPSRDGA